jgi:hypothetical protein
MAMLTQHWRRGSYRNSGIWVLLGKMLEESLANVPKPSQGFENIPQSRTKGKFVSSFAFSAGIEYNFG